MVKGAAFLLKVFPCTAQTFLQNLNYAYWEYLKS